MNAFEKFDNNGDEPDRKDVPLSALVKRLISARQDAAKSEIHWHLTQHTDERLRESLGFTNDDIRALRAGKFLLPWPHRPTG